MTADREKVAVISERVVRRMTPRAIRDWSETRFRVGNELVMVVWSGGTRFRPGPTPAAPSGSISGRR